MNPIATAQVAGWPLAGLRVSLGGLFLVACTGKLAAGDAWPDRMAAFLEMHREKAFDFYWPFIEQVVLPNKALFGYAVAYGELAIGLGLVAGAATRLASFFGIAMVLNFLWVKGATFWLPTNHDALFILILATLMFGAAGRVLGVDYWLHQRRPLALAW